MANLGAEKKKKVLVIRLSSLGDVVLSTTVLAPLRAAGYDVFFLTKKSFASVLEGDLEKQNIFSFDSSLGEKEAQNRVFLWFASQRFDAVLDLQDSWRTWKWRFFFKKSATVMVAKKERVREVMILLFRMGCWFSFGRGGRARKFRRAAQDFLLAEKNLSPLSGPLTSLSVSESEKEEVKGLLPQGDYVVLLPGSAWPGKVWSSFPQLGSLISRKTPVVVLGAHKDLICDEIQRESMAGACISLRGKTSLRQSMAVLAGARWVIGNDTGMVHVAEALGKDVAMIEGPTHQYMGFSPYRERSLLLGIDLVCRPCSKSGRICVRFGNRKCLKGLSLAVVAEKLRRWGLPC